MTPAPEGGTLMSVDEIAANLVRQYHIDPDRAREKALQIAGIPKAREARPVIEQLVMPQIPWPFKLRIPWSHLVSDNEITAAIVKGHAVPLRTKKYREAKKALRKLAATALGGPNRYEPANYPLEVTAEVWVPDPNRVYDVNNIGKCILDALETVLYTKDHWAHRTHWLRMGCDVDAPRAELTVTRIL